MPKIRNRESCCICEGVATELHEPLMGAKYRKLSIKHGLQIPLCRSCHRRLHDNPELNEKYQQEMQLNFEAEHGHAEFMRVFGRNYL